MKRVCLYIDEGASFEVLLSEIAREMDHTQVRLEPVLAEDILDHDCLKEAQSFIMPGGADLPFCSKLNGRGNRLLRDFVEAGGSYLGVCAGAYYGCRALAYHAGRPDEISGARELALIDAVAVGSLPELGPYYDLTIATASAPRLDWSGVGVFRGYYHGGPRFDVSAEGDAIVFARYPEAENTPAGVERIVGAGKAVLVGVHLEMAASTLAMRLLHLQGGDAFRHLVTLISDSESHRRRAFRDLLHRAGLPLKSMRANLQS